MKLTRKVREKWRKKPEFLVKASWRHEEVKGLLHINKSKQNTRDLVCFLKHQQGAKISKLLIAFLTQISARTKKEEIWSKTENNIQSFYCWGSFRKPNPAVLHRGSFSGHSSPQVKSFITLQHDSSYSHHLPSECSVSQLCCPLVAKFHTIWAVT